MPRPFNGERAIFSTNVLGKLDLHMQKNRVGPLPDTVYKNYLKDLSVGPKTIKLIEENRAKASLHWIWQ